MFADQLKSFSVQVEQRSGVINTEEATKTALVMPFLSLLGYDVFDPLEVIPEFTADVGTKKGEKVDYGIKVAGELAILVECKVCNFDLSDAHASQLFRYFGTTDARFAILTNGIQYRFYTDLDKQNRMDERPFFTFNVKDYDESSLAELSRFKKEVFDVEIILGKATGLKYINLLRSYLKTQFEAPDEDFARFIGKQVFTGKMTQQSLEMFQGLIRRALEHIIKDRLRERFDHVLNEEDTTAAEDEHGLVDEGPDNDIETTEDEVLGYRIVQAIVAQRVEPSRVYIRDAKSYCAILFDDNNRKPLVRLHFNSALKRISLFNDDANGLIDVSSVEDLYLYQDQILKTLEKYT